MTNPIQYRRMRPEDEDQAVTLWAFTFGSNDPEVSRRYIRPDPDYLDHTLLAVTEDGTIAATLHYWLYNMRDAKGEPQLVGAISHVTTREEHRRQGHAAALLQWSFEDMSANGCEWTLLFSSDMGVPLYERHGFRRYSHPYRRGVLTRQHPDSPVPYIVERTDQPGAHNEWSFLAPVYDAYNATRPLSRVRDADYWRNYYAVHMTGMLENHRGILYTARADNGDLCGYCVARFSTEQQAREQLDVDQVFSLAELCVLPDHRDATPALISAAIKDALPGKVGGRYFLPYEEPAHSFAHIIYGPTLNEEDDRFMFARPLSPSITYEDIQAIFAAPGAHFWPLDSF